MFRNPIVGALAATLVSCASGPPVAEVAFNHEYRFGSEIEQDLGADPPIWKHQIAAADYATKGDYRSALEQWDLAFPGNAEDFTQEQISSVQSKYRLISAVEYILEQSKAKRVVIINEAHHNSSHRAFTRSLLQGLFDNGYRHLGLEALEHAGSAVALLNERKYPVQGNGHYIKDPQFGNLVRNALEIGYKVFGYETSAGGGGKAREIAQAKNIQKAMENDPTGKFLVHCGFDHALEGPNPFWGKAMAGRLTEFTGVDPLTINQTFFSERGSAKRTHPLLSVLGVQQPSVLLDGNNVPYRYERAKSWSDMAVFHPNTEYVDGRPDWLFRGQNRTVPIALRGMNLVFPAMVFAFKQGEDIYRAIPVDIHEVGDGDAIAHLALPPGMYRIIIASESAEVESLTLEVN